MTSRVLVVSHEPEITALVARHLSQAGYRVSIASGVPEAIEVARQQPPRIIILDLMPQVMSGPEVLRELRSKPETRDAGVILLTTGHDDTDLAQLRTLGADDHLTKPIDPAELGARVAALLQRPGSTLSAGPIVIDRSARGVSLGGVELNLTATEYKLLLTLVERAGTIQSRPQLLETVWEAHPEIQTRTVDMHVQRLRAKLGTHGRLIETVRGSGYRFLAHAPKPPTAP